MSDDPHWLHRPVTRELVLDEAVRQAIGAKLREAKDAPSLERLAHRHTDSIRRTFARIWEQTHSRWYGYTQLTQPAERSRAPLPPAGRASWTVNEFLAVVGIGRTKLYQEIAAGRLRILKVGKRTLISAAAAQAWFDLLDRETPPPRTHHLV